MAGVDSYVKLLLHGDGDDASIWITDQMGKTVTAVNGAQIDTAQYKFGNSSILFDGTTDKLTVPDSADWDLGSGDFTIDFWFRSAATPNAYDTFIGSWNSTPSTDDLYKFDLGASGTHPRFTASASSSTIVEYYATDAQTFTTGTWYHMAVVRSGTNLYIFKDGTSLSLTVGNAINSESLPNTTGGLTIGLDPANSGRDINGHIDELRFSKGVARWTENFTPPTEAYSGDSIITQHTCLGSTQYIYNANATFATARDATSGTVDNTGNYIGVDYASSKYYFYHSFSAFDTSWLPDDATITTASLFVYCLAKATTSAEDICIVQSSQASATSLAANDYDNCGDKNTPAEGATRVGQAGFTVNAWTEIALNATGISWINKTGNTLIGLRGSNDVDNNSAGVSTAGRTYISLTGAAYATANLRPYLKITYTTASGPAGLKTLDGLAKASVKTIDGLAIASVKTYNGLA